jgi:transposase
MVKGCESENVSKILKKISKYKRHKVKEVTLDMAASMQKIVTDCFPRAEQVTDRFHVQKLAFDALQEIRIAHRWDAIDQENKEYKLAKETGKKFTPEILENGDTHKQLLARSRYLLFKAQSKWTPKQGQRAKVLFKYYPDIEKAYKLSQELGSIYRFAKSKGIAYT